MIHKHINKKHRLSALLLCRRVFFVLFFFQFLFPTSFFSQIFSASENTITVKSGASVYTPTDNDSALKLDKAKILVAEIDSVHDKDKNKGSEAKAVQKDNFSKIKGELHVDSGSFVYIDNSSIETKTDRAKILVAEGGLVYNEIESNSFEIEIINKDYFAKQKTTQKLEKSKNVLVIAKEKEKEVTKSIIKEVQKRVNHFVFSSKPSSNIVIHTSKDNFCALSGSYFSDDLKNIDHVSQDGKVLFSIDSKKRFSYKTRNISLQDFNSCIFTRPPPVFLA